MAFLQQANSDAILVQDLYPFLGGKIIITAVTQMKIGVEVGPPKAEVLH